MPVPGLGVTGPRAVRLVGAKADGWSVFSLYMPPEQLRPLNDIITASAEEAGRDPERARGARQRDSLAFVAASASSTAVTSRFPVPSCRFPGSSFVLVRDYQAVTRRKR